MKLSPTHNLLTCFPEIAAEWDYEANFPRRPESVTPGSHQRVGWKCEENPTHKWITTPRNRTTSKTGCPCCSGRVSTTTHSLAFCFPEIAAQWDYETNFPLRPEDVGPRSPKKVGWRCLVNQTHRWMTRVADRTGIKCGCPYCSGRFSTITNKSKCLFPRDSCRVGLRNEFPLET